MNFSPVVDVTTHKDANIYPRTFNHDWGELGAAMVEGYLESDILPVVKHFPFYGNFSGNVEEQIPIKLLSEQELTVFSQSTRNAPILMISPIIIQNIDPDKPAPISKKAIQYIRDELMFDGITITDDILMQSIRKHYPPVEFALEAIDAGVDIVLFSNISTAFYVYQQLHKKAKYDELLIKRINESVKRILKAKKHLT